MKHLKHFKIFEKVEALDDLDLPKITATYNHMIDEFHKEDDINDHTINFFIEDVINLFKNNIKYFDWQALSYALNDFLSSDGTYDEVFSFVLDYLDNHPELFSKKIEKVNKKTGIFENLDIQIAWKELYELFVKNIVEPSKEDNDKHFLSYLKDESVQKQLHRNQYIRNKTIDFFKVHNFNADWHSINTMLTWKDMNGDIENNFDIAFNFIKKVIETQSPEQILSNDYLKQTNKNIGLFENDRAEFLKWKRKNVTLRGIKEVGIDENGGSAILGKGLYTAFLGNRQMAKQYGTVRFVLNAIPKNPLIVQSINAWEIYLQRLIIEVMGKYDPREFRKNHTIEEEIMKKGYDGVIIPGREMVNYKPENILYFSNENQLYNYWYDYFKTNI